jgi:hypothetical protein
MAAVPGPMSSLSSVFLCLHVNSPEFCLYSVCKRSLLLFFNYETKDLAMRVVLYVEGW